MKLLIVGASGFLGRNLLLGVPRNWEVYATYNTSPSFLRFLKTNGLDRVRAYKCDLSKEEDCKALTSSVGDVDTTLYLAADSNLSSFISDPSLDVARNIVSMVNFLKHHKGRRVVYLSSGAVYMGRNGLVSPRSKLEPSIPYAISKLANEQYLNFFSKQGRTVESHVILRFFGSFGPYESTRKISFRLIAALQRGDTTFTIRGDGMNYIDMMCLDDAVRGLMTVLESDVENITVDMCKGSRMTINDYAELVATTFEKHLEIRHEGVTHEYIAFHASPAQMERVFGFKPKKKLEDGLKDYAQWVVKHLDDGNGLL